VQCSGRCAFPAITETSFTSSCKTTGRVSFDSIALNRLAIASLSSPLTHRRKNSALTAIIDEHLIRAAWCLPACARSTTHLDLASTPCQLAWREPSFLNRTRRNHPSPTTSSPAGHLRWPAGGEVGTLVRTSIYIQNSFTCETSSQGSQKKCVVQRAARERRDRHQRTALVGKRGGLTRVLGRYPQTESYKCLRPGSQIAIEPACRTALANPSCLSS
jgi:hypothetical protein